MKDLLKYAFIIIVTLLSLSCENTAVNFIKTFEGTINQKYPIAAKIQLNDGIVSGNYIYTKTGEELKLKGIIDSKNELLIKAFDEEGNQTSIFEGRLIAKNKMEGLWSKLNEKETMPFLLIESNTNYESLKKTTNSIKILYRQEEFDKNLKTNLPVIKINQPYLDTAEDGIRAIIAYYSSISGTDCWWEDDEANSAFTNLNCLLTSALNLGHQCSESHKSFMQKWFSEEKEMLNKIDECYFVPFTATSQTTYDFLNLEVTGNKVTVRYKIEGANARTQSSWEREGIDIFRINGNKIKVISRQEL